MFLTTWAITARSDYEVHQHVHHLFESKERVFLWRRGHHDVVHILSTTPPRQTVRSRTIALADIPVGRPVSFALRFVAARCLRREGKLGAKIPIRGMRERRLWLADRLSQAGARLLFANVNDDVVSGQGGLKIIGAEATGTLLIEDRARFAARWQVGFGRNRAFGCGLLWMPEVCA